MTGDLVRYTEAELAMMNDVPRGMRQIEVTIPSTHEVYVANVVSHGRFDVERPRLMSAELTLKTRPRLREGRRWTSTEPMHAEMLPNSLAYALAQAVAVPIEVSDFKPSLVDWRVVNVSICSLPSIGTEIEFEFEAFRTAGNSDAQIHWHIQDWVAPRWFANAIRAFVGPLFATEWLTDVSPS